MGDCEILKSVVRGLVETVSSDYFRCKQYVSDIPMIGMVDRFVLSWGLHEIAAKPIGNLYSVIGSETTVYLTEIGVSVHSTHNPMVFDMCDPTSTLKITNEVMRRVQCHIMTTKR